MRYQILENREGQRCLIMKDVVSGVPYTVDFYYDIDEGEWTTREVWYTGCNDELYAEFFKATDRLGGIRVIRDSEK